MIDRRVVSCGSNAEKKQWVDTLRQQAKQGPGHIPVKPENLQVTNIIVKLYPNVCNFMLNSVGNLI